MDKMGRALGVSEWTCFVMANINIPVHIAKIENPSFGRDIVVQGSL